MILRSGQISQKNERFENFYSSLNFFKFCVPIFGNIWPKFHQLISPNFAFLKTSARSRRYSKVWKFRALSEERNKKIRPKSCWRLKLTNFQINEGKFTFSIKINKIPMFDRLELVSYKCLVKRAGTSFSPNVSETKPAFPYIKNYVKYVYKSIT